MNNKFSENLKKIRKENGLSQEQLADELGVSRQAISKWESAVAYPEMDKIITLCEKFNLNIDDLLHKDIKEVRSEEESKKNINKYIDDFLNFITNTINLFCNMSFKSKCKCLFEQIVIGSILLVVCLIIGSIGENLLYTAFDILPDKLFSILYSLFSLVYVLFSIIISVVIIVHIFKTRYLDYYDTIKKDVINEQKEDDITSEELDNKEKNIEKKNKIHFNKNKDKIIIRDPKHSEYRFINGLFKGIVGFIKFFILCFSLILFLSLITLFCLLVISFLAVKTGLFFIGLLLTLLSAGIITIILILLSLNFVFNRKNDKKKMIWSFLLSLIMLGTGIGLIIIGALNFEYIENDKSILKTNFMEIDMKNNLTFGYHYPEIEYIESNNDNIKIKYTINKYCEINHSDLSNKVIHIWASCENPIKLVKEVINNFNNKKIVLINNQLRDIKIYTTKENIEILKKNYEKYTDIEVQHQNTINYYENEINNLQSKIDYYIQKELEYKEEINELKNQIFMYENNEE
ncbi:MAG: helix-turn-helix transcriptional regulator [Bacilli bacterium]|nr:helix-turn-helix transcriptional regulator [Bacilli bacterium]